MITNHCPPAARHEWADQSALIADLLAVHELESMIFTASAAAAEVPESDNLRRIKVFSATFS
jgi:hypothetical protein